jgi:hypothetical protein
MLSNSQGACYGDENPATAKPGGGLYAHYTSTAAFPVRR